MGFHLNLFQERFCSDWLTCIYIPASTANGKGGGSVVGWTLFPFLENKVHTAWHPKQVTWTSTFNIMLFLGSIIDVFVNMKLDPLNHIPLQQGLPVPRAACIHPWWGPCGDICAHTTQVKIPAHAETTAVSQHVHVLIKHHHYINGTFVWSLSFSWKQDVSSHLRTDFMHYLKVAG